MSDTGYCLTTSDYLSFSVEGKALTRSKADLPYMVRVEVEVLCPNCSAWYKVGFVELDRETLDQLRSLLSGIRFEPLLGLQPSFEKLSDVIRLTEKRS